MIANWKAVLFDLDGTLIDSEWFYYRAWKKTLEHYGFTLDSELWVNDLAGKSDGQQLKFLHSNYGLEIDEDTFVVRLRHIIAEQYEKESVPLMPGVMELLRFLQEQDITMAVVTSSKREAAIYHVERNGLQHFFKVLVSRSDVEQPKPNPEPYLRCMAQLELGPADCLVLEDSITGATAAKAAGLTCFGVQTHADVRRTLPSDRTFNDLHEVHDFLEHLRSAVS